MIKQPSIETVVPVQAINELLIEMGFVDHRAAGVVGGVAGVATRYRKADRYNIDSHMFPDVRAALLEFARKYDTMGRLGRKWDITGSDVLRYTAGGHFARHQDNIARYEQDAPRRVFTTVTLLDKSADLVGGDLEVFYSREHSEVLNLKVGETAIFLSSTYHQVTPVKCGERTTLVGWIG